MKLITDASAEKLRGGFYTPEPIAKFILQWGINGRTDLDILEPSCGDGVFLEQIKENSFTYNSITAVELDSDEAAKAATIPLKDTEVVNTEFHEFCNSTDKRFDLILGNPPYIRYQYFDEQQQVQAEDIFIKSGLKYSRLTNAWVSFIVGSSLLIKETGKIGFVIPAEFLQVSYAKQLRQFIAYFYNKINIISFKKLVFPEIQQEVILLLCEKNTSSEKKIEHIEVDDIEALKGLDFSVLKSPKKKLDSVGDKWTFYFLEQEEIDFLIDVRQSNIIPTLGKFAKVEVGITTGANEFFTVPQAVVEQYQLQDFARPMVGRSVQVSSLNFTKEDWLQNQHSGARANLLVFPENGALKKHEGALEYIADGENKKIHKGYKCRIRDNWYVVPSLKLSNALFIRRNNKFPKLILNRASAYTTDTMHRVYVKPQVDIKAFTTSFYNSLSLAFSEIVGRSYGGGVLELMPSEVEKILLPYQPANAALFLEVDDMLRSKQKIESILEKTDNYILKEQFGFSSKEIDVSRSIWKKLSQRRLTRAKSK